MIFWIAWSGKQGRFGLVLDEVNEKKRADERQSRALMDHSWSNRKIAGRPCNLFDPDTALDLQAYSVLPPILISSIS